MTTRRHLDVSGYMSSGQYTDLKLVCEDQEFLVHRLVVCSQSPVLAAALKEGFQEAQSGVIRISGFDRQTAKWMIEYFYTGDYGTDTSENSEGPRKALKKNKNAKAPRNSQVPTTEQHIKVNAIAHYYDVQGLCALARDRVAQIFQDKWDCKAFCDAVRTAILLNNDQKMHQTLADEAATHLDSLVNADDWNGMVDNFGVLVLKEHVWRLNAAERRRDKFCSAALARSLLGRKPEITLKEAFLIIFGESL